MSLTGKVAADKLLRGKISKLDVIYTDTYEIAVKNGYKGTVEEWLASLKGEPGEKGEKGDTGATGAKGDKGDKGDPGEKGATGAQGEQGIQGIQGPKGDTGAQGPKGDKGDTGPQGPQGIQGPQGDGGSGKSVKAYGATGNGSTNDTAAFKAALNAERVVYVPGGTYKLNEGIVIGDNCCLELAQDAVLEFTQTTGNCITLGMLSNLKGNHATVKVPYAFEGNVLYAYSNDHTNADIYAVPPWTLWDPQWKSGRYVTDLNICKADSRGYHYAVNPDECKGAAVYLSADHTVGMSTFMWGIHFSGLRIAGAFSYGIHCKNIDGGWLNDMRIDAYIDACEIGVQLEDCGQAYISAIIQPRRAYTESKVYIPYAKHGIKLVRSKNVDMSGSRIWDWFNTDPDKLVTLWTENGEYQPYAMIGNCNGAIINDYCYYENDAPDIRKRIFTDSDINLDTMTVLQEPITRWFKIKNNDPYYTDGLSDHKLITQAHLDAHFDTGVVKDFTDRLPMATDTDGSIYNGTGYKMNTKANSYGGGITDDPYHLLTGFIPCNKSSQINGANFTFAKGDDDCRIIMFDANFNYVMHVNRGNLLKGKTYYVEYTEKTDGFTLQINGVGELNNVAYFRFVVYKAAWGENPMIAVDEEVKYTVEGFLADSVKVKGENVIGTPGQTNPDWVATKEESGGDTIVISEQTITSGMWSKRQYDIVPEIAYEVYVNGVRYTCKAYNYDGGIILGNYTIANKNANVPHKNEPFYIYWAGGSATSGMFGKDSTLSYPITLKVTDEIVTVYNKMPEGYLPDGVVMEDDLPDVKDGEKGDPGERGTGILNVTTAPSSYTTAVNGVTPAYRISLSTVTTQAKVDKVLVGDSIRYNYYIYPVVATDDSYVYCGIRVSIRGSTGAAGAAGSDYVLTDADKTEIAEQAAALVPSGGVDVTASVGQTIVVKEVDSNGKPTKWEAVDYIEPLIGATADVTPAQVAEALAAGRPIVMSYTDDTFGTLVFNAFTICVAFNNAVQASQIFHVQGAWIASVLIGEGSGIWHSFSTYLQPLTT